MNGLPNHTGTAPLYARMVFEPTTLAIMAVVSTVASVAGSVMSGMQAQSAAKAQAAMAQQAADVNAQNSERLAERARQEAQANEDRQREKTRQMLATQRAAVGSSGVQLEGSPLEVLAYNAGQQELDALSIRYEGQKQAEDLRWQAQVQRYGGQVQAASYEIQGQKAASTAYTQAGTSLMSGASTWGPSVIKAFG